MPKTTFDWTWTIEDEARNIFVELDVRVHGEYNLPIHSSIITITGVQACFKKHGREVFRDIPDDLLRIALVDLQRDELLQRRWTDYLIAREKSDALDAKADHERERKED